MPNRYEREIEEILRNLEQANPKSGRGQKFGERFRKNPGTPLHTQQPRSFSWNLSTSERMLLAAVICALLSGGIAYVWRPGIVTLILALISFVCLVIVALSHFILQPRRSQSKQYGNITITPLRRGPLSTIRTQWNLFKLKVRYRRKNEKE